MKYTWIEYKAYLSFDNLKQYIQKVFDNYGSKYLIDFVVSGYQCLIYMRYLPANYSNAKPLKIALLNYTKVLCDKFSYKK